VACISHQNPDANTHATAQYYNDTINMTQMLQLASLLEGIGLHFNRFGVFKHIETKCIIIPSVPLPLIARLLFNQSNFVVCAFARIDLDSDGLLSSTEISAAILTTGEEEHELDGATPEARERFYREQANEPHRLLSSFDQRTRHHERFVSLVDVLEARYPNIQAFSTKEHSFEEITMAQFAKLSFWMFAKLARPLELAQRATDSETITGSESGIVDGYWTERGASAAVKNKLGQLGADKFDASRKSSSCFPPATVEAAKEKAWIGADVPTTLLDRCDIPKEGKALTPLQFRDLYFKPGIPVVIRNGKPNPNRIAVLTPTPTPLHCQPQPQPCSFRRVGCFCEMAQHEPPRA